ncbi:TetR/AcrR family transcriptional regulator [Micromonosporaceae bacterium B7E4]
MSPYHHGNLRRAIIDAALTATEEAGPSGWSLRELARRAGVSHTAPVHHFGDKTGVLTAVAAEGYRLFADALEQTAGDFFEAGVAYVRFAEQNRGYFDVMFRPDLYRADDPAVTAARERARGVLVTGARGLSPTPEQDRAVMLGVWSIVHGFASLWLSGAITESTTGDAATTARSVFQVMLDQLLRNLPPSR